MSCRLRALAIAAALAAAASPAAAVTYLGAGAAIPDNSSSLSSITVADSFKIGDVNVRLDGLSHNFAGDVQFYLINGLTSIQLFKNHGWNNYLQGSLTFDDEATASITTFPQPLTTSYQPYQTLSGFDGLGAAGTWSLKAVDTAGGVAGSYRGWSLELTEQVVSPAPEPATWAMMIAGFGLAGTALRNRRLVAGVA